jgi:hypothetical protein
MTWKNSSIFHARKYLMPEVAEVDIYRVLKKGGIGYLVIPSWWNPHAGHGLKPFHVLPFPVAKF